jgi:hypothetical protein
MKKLIITLAVLALFASAAFAVTHPLRPMTERVENPGDYGISRANVLFWGDDNEHGGVPGPGWTTGDDSATPQTIYWHVSTFNAEPGGTYSYYCGEETLTPDGGYRNSLDQRLDIPSTPHPAPYGMPYYPAPLLSYDRRYDSEPGFDWTQVELHQGGVYVGVYAAPPDPAPKVLMGNSGGWVYDVGVGIDLTLYDDPMIGRFRFTSDVAWSDQDLLYDSDGGAVNIDNIKVWDAYSMDVTFFDDVEDGVGQCTFSVPIPSGATGDYWHLVDGLCWPVTGSWIWWSGDDSDTLHLPANLNNWVSTPHVDMTSAASCTMQCYIQIKMPHGADGDYWCEQVSNDGGATWIDIDCWGGGDQCYYGLSTCAGLYGYPSATGLSLSALLPAPSMAYRILMVTNETGSGPSVCGHTGFLLDDVWFYGEEVTSVEESSWGKIKAIYK